MTNIISYINMNAWLENTKESLEKLKTENLVKWQISNVEELYKEKFQHPSEEYAKEDLIKLEDLRFLRESTVKYCKDVISPYTALLILHCQTRY